LFIVNDIIEKKLYLLSNLLFQKKKCSNKIESQIEIQNSQKFKQNKKTTNDLILNRAYELKY